jgi:hypothetical protein
VSTPTSASAPRPVRENIFVNLACTVAAPALILSKLSAPERLGPVLALIIALAFPIGYALWDFAKRKKVSFVAGIGFVSTLLTGGFGLAQVDGIWFAVKEASVPLAIGLMVVLSMKTRRPLIREFLYNDQVIDVAKVDAALDARGNRSGFDRLLARASWLVVASFLISAVLNFFLARWILTTHGLTRAALAGDSPVLLTSPGVRPYVRSIIERFRGQTVVMSQNEVHPRARLRTIGTV